MEMKEGWKFSDKWHKSRIEELEYQIRLAKTEQSPEGYMKEGWINGKLLPWPVLVNWYAKEEIDWTVIDDMINSVEETGEITKEQYHVFRDNGQVIRDKNICTAELRVEELKEHLRLAKIRLKDLKETEQSPECCMCHHPLMQHTYKQFAICMSSSVIEVKA